MSGENEKLYTTQPPLNVLLRYDLSYHHYFEKNLLLRVYTKWLV